MALSDFDEALNRLSERCFDVEMEIERKRFEKSLFLFEF